jgi:hypothetical protein
MRVSNSLSTFHAIFVAVRYDKAIQGTYFQWLLSFVQETIQHPNMSGRPPPCSIDGASR